MAKKDIARLTAAEHDALASWASKYGSSWKKYLRQARGEGRLSGHALSAFNKIGPSGLIAYRLTMANPARKRVPSKRANPAMHLPPRPSDRASHVAWDAYMEKVDALPVSFAGQPAYVRDLWNLTAMGFGKVSSDGTLVSFARKDHGDVWRKHPALKSKSIARIRLHEEGMVTPVRSVKVSNPARKRISKGR